jgi:ElaB/YqjD/DUF883 family membrane-anchored ribosome-binding protein
MSQTTKFSDLGISTSDRVAAMAHDTLDRVTPQINRAEQEVRDAATQAADSVKDLEKQALDAAEASLSKARSFISANPITTLGIAFAAGVLACVFVRR